jgi:hypothetical protein
VDPKAHYANAEGEGRRMFDDVVIGSGPQPCSAHLVDKIKGDHNISQNNVAYWVDGILGVGIQIYKNTEEGRRLTDMIDKEKRLQTIMGYINHLILRHVPAYKLEKRIKAALENSFEAGKEAKAAEIREILGVY